MISTPVIANTNQNAARLPLYEPESDPLIPFWMEPTAARPTAEPIWRAPLKMAPTVPAMDEGAERKIAMLADCQYLQAQCEGEGRCLLRLDVDEHSPS